MEIQDIALDSNVYRNFSFINYLVEKKDDFNVHIPTIVFVELGYFFISKGLSWETYLSDLEKFNGKMLEWGVFNLELLINNAYDNRAELAFKNHFRDYLIGLQCMNLKLQLVTYNQRHFTWCEGISIITPEDLVAMHDGTF